MLSPWELIGNVLWSGVADIAVFVDLTNHLNSHSTISYVGKDLPQSRVFVESMLSFLFDVAIHEDSEASCDSTWDLFCFETRWELFCVSWCDDSNTICSGDPATKRAAKVYLILSTATWLFLTESNQYNTFLFLQYLSPRQSVERSIDCEKGSGNKK